MISTWNNPCESVLCANIDKENWIGHPLLFVVSVTYGSRDFGIVLENLPSSRFFLFFLSKCYRGQTKFKIEPGVYNLKF